MTISNILVIKPKWIEYQEFNCKVVASLNTGGLHRDNLQKENALFGQENRLKAMASSKSKIKR